MRFLKLKTSYLRPDGSKNRTALVVDAPRKYAPEHARDQKALSKKKCQLILGAHDSGKSRWLERIYAKHAEVYGTKAAHPLFLSAVQPLSSWVDVDHVAKWHDANSKTEWKRLNQHQRSERLHEYVSDTNAILYIDDAHKLTGRKNQIARKCLISARIWLMTANNENRLPPNIRTLVERKEPQRTHLESDASYDSTMMFMWILAAVLALGGAWEIAAVLAGLNALGRGRNSARAD